MPPYEVGSPADPLLGKAVEGYRITNLIGKGGMGAVYEAVHDGIGQRTAVKVLFPEFSTDVDAVGRFVAEARAASRVQHGGLVKIFYSGRLEDGTAYIMMEFLDGESIEQRSRRLKREGKRLELGAVVRIGQQIASALSAVHREGIVHRDLKPANILLVADPEIEGGERIKVVDFGIAKFDRSTTEISKTTVGRFLGTALYASPEQCQMAGEVGPRADVYALGVMLYELVAGKPPFEADQPGTVIGMHLFMQPAPLWGAAPDVPEALHRLIHQMLAKAPDRRPSMEEVLSRLAEIKIERPRLLWRLRRDRRAVVAVAGMVALVGAGTLWRLVHVDVGQAARNVPARPAALLAAPVSVEAPVDLAAGPPVEQAVAVALPEPPASDSLRSKPERDAPIRANGKSSRQRRRGGKLVAAPLAKRLDPVELPEPKPVAVSPIAPSTAAPSPPQNKPPEVKPTEHRAVGSDTQDDGIIR